MAIEKKVQIVAPQFGFMRSLIVIAILLNLPATSMARGGGGGGGGGGRGGGGGGGGHLGGARGGAVASPGFRGYGGGAYHGHGGGGYHGYGAGYRGYTGGHPGYVGRHGGYGWGYPGYYGYGYPYYGYGLGLGLGLGLGYGLSSGYGYGGYGGYGYPAYGYLDSGYASGAYAAAVPSGSTTYSGSSTPANSSPVVTASASTPSSNANTAKAREFVKRGETAFKAADYEGAIYAWRHAIVDDPQNPVVVLQLAQALFATGKYEEAAGATQAAMHTIPKEDWGVVVIRYQELYGNKQDYTRQLRELEKAMNSQPESPALRFLAGYHYGYLGFLKPSVEQLEKAIELESRDEMAQQLRDEMKTKLAMLDIPPAPPSATPTPASATPASWTKSR